LIGGLNGFQALTLDLATLNEGRDEERRQMAAEMQRMKRRG